MDAQLVNRFHAAIAACDGHLAAFFHIDNNAQRHFRAIRPIYTFLFHLFSLSPSGERAGERGSLSFPAQCSNLLEDCPSLMPSPPEGDPETSAFHLRRRR